MRATKGKNSFFADGGQGGCTRVLLASILHHTFIFSCPYTFTPLLNFCLLDTFYPACHAIPMKKTCPRCQKLKPLTSFGSNAAAPDGKAWYCKPCAAEKQREWKMKNPRKVKKWRISYNRRRKDEARA